MAVTPVGSHMQRSKFSSCHVPSYYYVSHVPSYYYVRRGCFQPCTRSTSLHQISRIEKSSLEKLMRNSIRTNCFFRQEMDFPSLLNENGNGSRWWRFRNRRSVSQCVLSELQAYGFCAHTIRSQCSRARLDFFQWIALGPTLFFLLPLRATSSKIGEGREDPAYCSSIRFGQTHHSTHNTQLMPSNRTKRYFELYVQRQVKAHMRQRPAYISGDSRSSQDFVLSDTGMDSILGSRVGGGGGMNRYGMNQ